jgi:hypothetical protein
MIVAAILLSSIRGVNVHNHIGGKWQDSKVLKTLPPRPGNKFYGMFNALTFLC